MAQLYTPTQLEKGLLAVFLDQVAKEGENLVSRLATRIPSGSDSEKYAWIGQAPQMSEVTDETEFKALSDTGYTLTNKLFAAGLVVKRSDIDDDKTGGIVMRTRQLAQVGMRHPNKLLINALINGTDSTLGACYDGGAFFADAHAARGDEGGTQDNLLAGTGTTTAQVATDLNSAVSALCNFKAENGEPFGEGQSQFAIVAPPALRKPMSEAINAGIISNTSNVQFSGMSFDVVYSARLSDANDWYLLHIGDVVRPLIYQDRDPLSFHALEEGDAAFVREQYKYKARARGVAGYAHWQNAVKTVNS